MNAPRSQQAWQLPDGIDELLPEAAARVEDLRRRLLDTASRWGYRLVVPPMLEFTDSLLVGVGEDLDLLTYKVPDQLTGRMMGLRADMTPQVARIDAHSLGGEGVNRLCYAGSTLHTRPASVAATRSPLQLGAELYGDSSRAADLEVIELMLSLLEEAGLAGDGLTVDLGHGGLFAPVLAASGLAPGSLQERAFDAVQRKSRPDLAALLDGLPESPSRLLEELMDLHGGIEILDHAAELLADIPEAAAAVAEVRALAEGLRRRHPALSLYIDLSELRGYRYHTGVVFAAYAQGFGEALARGGRYDNVGAVYGRARPATGFATDLRLLAAQTAVPKTPADAIEAPDLEDEALQLRIRELRDAGETVIVAVGANKDPRCGRVLTRVDGKWGLTERPRRESEEDRA